MENALVICETSIRRDAEGRYSLNDLHRAAGGANKHRPSLWAENQQTKRLIRELDSEAGIPALATTKGGEASGTFVAEELLYAYAAWVSPKFHLAVLRVFKSFMAEQSAALKAENAKLVPQANGYHLLTDSRGSRCITLAAKHLGLRPRELFDWLQEHKWMFRRPGARNYEVYQACIHKGYMTERITDFKHSDGTPDFSSTPHITNKGLAKLATIFGVAITLDQEAA